MTNPDREEADRYAAAIRKHRDQRGDDRCWLDDKELYSVLPEGARFDTYKLPPPCEMMANCARFIASRQDPSLLPYESPQAQADRLTAAIRGIETSIEATEQLCALPELDTDYVKGYVDGLRFVLARLKA